MTEDVIIVGAGSFSREVISYVREISQITPSLKLKGILDDDTAALSDMGNAEGVKPLGDTFSYEIKQGDRFLISIGNPDSRMAIAERLSSKGAKFLTIIHPRAYVASDAKVGKGCIIAPFASICTNAEIEDHTVINLYATVGHDSIIGKCSILSPHSIVNGGGRVGTTVVLGSHAVIMPNRQVGEGSKIAAGAVVYRNVSAHSMVIGNPARMIDRKEFDA